MDGEFAGFGTVGRVRLGGITRERGELRLEGGDVFVPAVSVRKLRRVGRFFELLEAFYVCLGGTIATIANRFSNYMITSRLEAASHPTM